MRNFYTNRYNYFSLSLKVILFCPIFAQILSAWKHRKSISAYGGYCFLLLQLPWYLLSLRIGNGSR
jgi:hypothetical protein